MHDDERIRLIAYLRGYRSGAGAVVLVRDDAGEDAGAVAPVDLAQVDVEDLRALARRPDRRRSSPRR